MTPQMLKRLTGALAAILAVWLVASLLRRAARDDAGQLSLARFEAEAVERFTLAKAGDTLRFDQANGRWTVNGYRADAKLVREMLAALTDTTARSELVAQIAASHQRLGLDSAAARRLTVARSGAVVADLLLGNRGSSYGSIYVRAPGDSAAYALTSRIADAADRSLDDWRDKEVGTLIPDSVAAIAVEQGRASYRLTRGAAGWTIGDAAADSSAVASLLERLRVVTANGFATPAQADSARFTPADKTIRVFARENRALMTLSADSTASGFWVRRDGDSTVYRLDTWTMGPLTPDAASLRKK
jgi:hypothetical protein